LDEGSLSSDSQNIRPDLSQQFMTLIFISWDADSTELKSVVARYSTGSGIQAEFLVPRIREIITTLYVNRLIVSNVCGDGATENQSTIKQLATLTVRDIFQPRCKRCALTGQEKIRRSLLDNLSKDSLPIAFCHPCDSNLKVLIGGEMPHLVKKIVNRLERSYIEKSKIALKFRVKCYL